MVPSTPCTQTLFAYLFFTAFVLLGYITAGCLANSRNWSYAVGETSVDYEFRAPAATTHRIWDQIRKIMLACTLLGRNVI